MNRRQFIERTNKLLAEERGNPLGWWYLSYADPERFRGGIYIEAHGPVEAAYLARHRNLSPGGELMLGAVPPEHLPPAEYRNRLLTKAEVQAANPNEECKTLAEFEAEGK